MNVRTRAEISESNAACVLVLIAGALLFASCGGGGGSSSSNPSNPSQNQSIAVSVSPASVTVTPSGSALFTATVTGTTNTAVSWSAQNIPGGNPTFGTISSSGVYTAPATPPNPSNVSITATSVADTSKSGTATVDVLVHHVNQDFQNPPIKLGTSGGNVNDKTTSNNKVFCCSGTLGALISRGGTLYVLSNNHVLDKSDQGTPGDPISQPGLADSSCGQKPNTIVANLTQSVSLENNTNPVDAAIAQIATGKVDTSGAILDLIAAGQPAPPSSTLATPTIGQSVAKSGDATGLTCSKVMATDFTVSVTYQTQCQGGTEFKVKFVNQVFINGASFSNNGDSGSLIVVTDTARPVALLYAGNDSGTVANPIQDVLSALKDPQSGEAPAFIPAPDHAVSCPATPQSQVAAEDNISSISTLPDSAVARARAIKNLHSAELMRDAAVIDVGVGRSNDNPNEAALLVFLNGRPQMSIPAQIEGVRTRIVPSSAFQPVPGADSRLIGMSGSEVARVRVVKERHSEALMSTSGIFAVGVGASKDSDDEGALIIFVERGKQVVIPAEIDGVRTRVIEAEPFRAFNWGRRTVNACSRKQW